jgi:hypothetical protein
LATGRAGTARNVVSRERRVGSMVASFVERSCVLGGGVVFGHGQ